MFGRGVLSKMHQHFLPGLAFLIPIGAHQLEVIVLPALGAANVDYASFCCSN
jgi:hypothetical protein